MSIHEPIVSRALPARAIPSLKVAAERRLQIALGVMWLFDGALQLQPFMFGRGFVTQVIAPNEIDQPGFVAAPIRLIADLIEPRVALFNLFAVTIQLLIGLGLIYRPTVKPALVTSLAWALGVWWIGEGLGGLLTGHASPLTGAPGAALLYIFAGLVVWPRARGRACGTPSGGILGARAARRIWATVWLGSAALWLLPANRATGAVHDAIANAPSGARWLTNLQSTVATAAAGHGLAIAVSAAVVSAAVGLAALTKGFARLTLAVSAVVAAIYCLLGQGIGGILTGSGTDPGTGPLIVLLAIAIYPLHRPGSRGPGRARLNDLPSQDPKRLLGGRPRKPQSTRSKSAPAAGLAPAEHAASGAPLRRPDSAECICTSPSRPRPAGFLFQRKRAVWRSLIARSRKAAIGHKSTRQLAGRADGCRCSRRAPVPVWGDPLDRGGELG